MHISKELTLMISLVKAHTKFLHELHAWWPQAYTWPQDKLENIYIEAKIDGMCAEIGPYNFG